jgi:hypothetical protein
VEIGTGQPCPTAALILDTQLPVRGTGAAVAARIRTLLKKFFQPLKVGSGYIITTVVNRFIPQNPAP